MASSSSGSSLSGSGSGSGSSLGDGRPGSPNGGAGLSSSGFGSSLSGSGSGLGDGFGDESRLGDGRAGSPNAAAGAASSGASPSRPDLGGGGGARATSTTEGSPPAVGIAVSQRKYLPAGAGAQDLHAILTVWVDGVDGVPGTDAAGIDRLAPSLAEVLVVDCSASMNAPEKKIRAARRAAATALEALPDGTPFAVVKGTHRAVTVYPPTGPMRPASAATRAEAVRAVYAMQAGGGTCVGDWLDLAGKLLTEQAAPIPHVLMLTDGRNEHDDRNPLAAVLDTWQGRFLCDAWGIGTEWDARVLLDVTSRLHGRADAVHDEAELPAAYGALIADLLAKPLPELEIRVTPAPGSRLRYLRQVFPSELDLPQAGARAGDGAGSGTGAAFTTRAWGNEVRRYQLCVSADPTGKALGEDLQAAVVEVAVPDLARRSSRGRPDGFSAVRLPPAEPCRVQWTDDPVPPPEDEEVEHFKKHKRLGDTVALAAEAFRLGRRDELVTLLGRAVSLAHELNDPRQLAELQRVVEIRDAAAGYVVLREGVTRDAFEHLITASTRTTHGPTSGGLPAGAAQVRPVAGLSGCPNCEARVPSNAKFCPNCRARLAPPVEAP
jgi:Mg-chelatase subunit ChlD